MNYSTPLFCLYIKACVFACLGNPQEGISSNMLAVILPRCVGMQGGTSGPKQRQMCRLGRGAEHQTFVGGLCVYELYC